jgi:hypothetical protein
VDSKPITLRNLGKCQGKPQCGETQRERERSYYYASGKYISAAKQHFQPRKIPHNTKYVPQKSASFSMPKPYRCLASSVPHFSCPQSHVRTVPHGPKTTTKNLETASKIVPKISSISVPKSVRLYGSVQYGLPQQKNILAKNSQKNFLGIRALFAAHFPLSSMLKKSL